VSFLLETLLEYGVTSDKLAQLARDIEREKLSLCEAFAEIELNSCQKKEIERIILMDPEQVERSAIEVGLTLFQLDLLKLKFWKLAG